VQIKKTNAVSHEMETTRQERRGLGDHHSRTRLQVKGIRLRTFDGSPGAKSFTNWKGEEGERGGKKQ